MGWAQGTPGFPGARGPATASDEESSAGPPSRAGTDPPRRPMRGLFPRGFAFTRRDGCAYHRRSRWRSLQGRRRGRAYSRLTSPRSSFFTYACSSREAISSWRGLTCSGYHAIGIIGSGQGWTTRCRFTRHSPAATRAGFGRPHVQVPHAPSRNIEARPAPRFGHRNDGILYDALGSFPSLRAPMKAMARHARSRIRLRRPRDWAVRSASMKSLMGDLVRGTWTRSSW